MTDIYEFLKSLEIEFERIDHDPVYTCEQASEVVGKAAGCATKNLFLRDDKGKRHALVVTAADKNVDLKALSQATQMKRPGLASPDRLMKYLGLEPGAVTPLALVNDPHRDVELFVDEDVWKSGRVQCHPLVNTATLLLAVSDLEKFFAATGHAPKVIRVAVKDAA